MNTKQLVGLSIIGVAAVLLIVGILYVSRKLQKPSQPVTAPTTAQRKTSAASAVSVSPFTGKGLCSFARTCPSGWSNHGTVGFIVHNDDKAKLDYDMGAAYNKDWVWQHPKLCCNDSGSLSQPTSTLKVGACSGIGAKSGMIVNNADLQKSGWATGAALNSDWTWQHYNTCKDNSGDYMLAAKCPAGWEDKGFGGLIYNNADLGQLPFIKGAGFNAGWTWGHPRICRFKK